MPRHAQQFAGDPDGDAAAAKTFDDSRRNFMALVFCLMVGTAALPHILMRYYTTPSVKEARRLGDVVAVLHLPAVLHRTGPGGTGQVRDLQRAGGYALRQTAGLDLGLVEGRSGFAERGRHQQGRHLPVGRDAHRWRHHRAGHARNRWSAVRGVGHGRSGRSGRGAVHGRRAAADHRQRAVSRPVLQDDRPERVDCAPSGDLQGPAAGGGPGGGIGGGTETGGHPVPGVGSLLLCGGGLLPGAGAGGVLETCQQMGRGAGHDFRAWASPCTTW